MSDFEFQSILEGKLRKLYAGRNARIVKGVPTDQYWKEIGYLEAIKEVLEACTATASQLMGHAETENTEERGYDS